ncbi:hypothetical protein E6R60_26420 [Streptomyces sp. A0642]|uniref:hypothetical protein n=1 Tax=Streptomyces sp. A0642 TaxID=2563100 RepID=UPI0010A29452|nr:hypothetical protein [Streptomyces sp. A0642]THA72468.1 hypothetical protein E6R60_26420 [Streptomyces sp. A0642]
MSRLYEYDEDSVLVGIVPQNCANCGGRVDRVRMGLQAVISSSGDFIGIQSVATTPCCNGQRNANYPVENLAQLLDHLQHCSNH